MSHASTRRAFLKTCLKTTAAAGLAATSTAEPQPASVVQVPLAPAGAGLKVLGRVPPRPGASIAASSLSVGFETLDRKMFDPERTYAHVAQLGVKWARVHTGWCRTELKRGEYDFAWLDRVVDSLRKIGVQPWFCVGFGNRLYTPEAPFETAVGWIPTGTDDGRSAWSRYVACLADHFRGRVRHFEIWNEPNGTSFWRPGKPDPRQYVDFVRLTASVIRQQIEDAVIIGGAVAGMETKFFLACMENGLGEHIQKASYHSYRFIPEHNYETDVQQWRKSLARHAPSVELWHGEVGAASQPGGAGGRANYPWTEPLQARWLLRRFVTDLRLKIELVSYFHTVDLVNYGGAEGPTHKTNFKGLLRGTDYTPKPAYFAYQNLASLFDSQTQATEIVARFSSEGHPQADNPENCICAGFLRKGKAMASYWMPTDPRQPFAARAVELTFPEARRLGWADPVLIDLLTGTIHAPQNAVRQGDGWKISAPLADYPMILADRDSI